MKYMCMSCGKPSRFRRLCHGRKMRQVSRDRWKQAKRQYPKATKARMEQFK